MAQQQNTLTTAHKAYQIIREEPGISKYRLGKRLGLPRSRMDQLLITLEGEGMLVAEWEGHLWPFGD
jgi:hypothetical protein